MSREFKREVRYIVIKLKDIDENTRRQLGNFMEDLEIPSRDCVVVESDWPEYEPVWKMIEDRVTGKAAIASREGDAVAELGWKANRPNTMRELRWLDGVEDWKLPMGTKLYTSPQAAAPECVWIYEEGYINDEDSWATSCGAKWQFITGGPEENNVKFCHKCGGKVVHKERTE